MQAMEWQILVLRLMMVVITEMIEHEIKEGERGFAMYGDVVTVVLHQIGKLLQLVLDGAKEHHQATQHSMC